MGVSTSAAVLPPYLVRYPVGSRYAEIRCARRERTVWRHAKRDHDGATTRREAAVR
jgi:hypothetical protein